jgi:predicted histidine transporter YuiF (NhaC family)
MGLTALIFGLIGGLCMVMGIVTAFGVVPLLGAELTWVFWFAVSAILLLISIAFALGRGGGYE